LRSEYAESIILAAMEFDYDIVIAGDAATAPVPTPL
jgi:hypothetical protein